MLLRKTIFTLLTIAASHCYGNDSLPVKDSSTVTITLQNAADKVSKIDSVFVIFDRFDLSGAGVVKAVFYPDMDNQFHVTLPKGKYFINIYCLGIYNKESFGRIVSAKPNKNHKIFLRLQVTDIYLQGKARIPGYHFDPTHLAIFNNTTK